MASSGTPVHSLFDVIPSTCCGVMSGLGVRYAERPLPEHSRKCVRVTDGKSLEIGERELERTVDEPVNEERVLRRIDRWDAGVDAREMKIGRRDRARDSACSGVSDVPVISPTGARCRRDERRSCADGARRARRALSSDRPAQTGGGSVAESCFCLLRAAPREDR